LRYELRTLVGEIGPEQVQSYLERRQEAEDRLGDTLRHRVGDGGWPGNVNWGMVALALVSLGAVAAGGVWLCTARRFRAPPGGPAPVPVDAGPQGLRGWLLLVGVGVVLSPFRFIVDFTGTAASYFSSAVWLETATPQGEAYHPLYGPLLMFEMVVNVLLIGLSVVACYLYFARRRLFPRIYITLLLASTSVLILDEVLGGHVISAAGLDAGADADSTKAIWGGILGCAIWCPYMLKSRRVKSTFLE